MRVPPLSLGTVSDTHSNYSATKQSVGSIKQAYGVSQYKNKFTEARGVSQAGNRDQKESSNDEDPSAGLSQKIQTLKSKIVANSN
jgi:hypothetical protein